MLYPKLLYVCLYTIFGSAIPYLPLFYDGALHLPSDQIGILLAIAPFVQSIACPVWTVVVDKRPTWHGPLMSTLAVIGGAGIMSLMILPTLLVKDEDSESKLDSSSSSSSSLVTLAITASLAFVFAFFGQPVATLVDSAVLKILGDQKILYGNQRLWGSISNGVNILLVGLWIGYAGINVAFYVFAFGVVSFAILAVFIRFPSTETMGAATMDHDLQHEDETESQRQPLLRGGPMSINRYTTDQQQAPMASSFLTALTNAVTGSSSYNADHNYVDDLPRRDSTASYANTELLDEYDGRALNLLCTTTTGAAMDAQMEATQRIANMDHLPPLGLVLSTIPTVETTLAAFADLGRPESKPIQGSTLKSRRVWTFLLTMLLFGISYSMIAQFLFLFLRNDLGMGSSLIGWTGPIGGVAEVTTFWISNKLLEEYSVTALLLFSHVALIARNIVYTILTPGELVSTVIALALQLSTGSAYALAWSTAVSEVDTFFPPDQRAMAQGVLAALFTGLGFGFGCIIGGTVYGQFGAFALCYGSAGIAAASLIIFMLGRAGRA